MSDLVAPRLALASGAAEALQCLKEERLDVVRLEAVGLTAAVASRLADLGISANVVAGYYHDHLLVPHHRAEEAVAAVRELAEETDR